MWITLTGFMASGKTTVGRTLGPDTHRPVVSLDERARDRAGCSIAEFFSRHGEPAFRTLELELMRELDRDANLVLDAGGGLVENPEAVALARERGVVIWLDTPWEIIRGRLEGSAENSRPLVEALGWEGLEELYNRRLPLYAQAADFRFRGSNDSPLDLARLVGLRCRLWVRQESRVQG